MEFFDEESRPRFLLQSRSPPKPDPKSETLDGHYHKPTLFISLSLSAFFLTLALFYFKFDPFQSIFIWISLSLLIGPFAPVTFTAGDIRVGQGPAIQPQSPPRQSAEPEQKRSRFRVRKPDPDVKPDLIESGNGNVNPRREKIEKIENSVVVVEESDWSDGDLEMLRKMILKYPVGMPGRWEAVAEAFSGRYKVENVVKTAKALGERRANDSDSFTRFLKDRKAVDKRVDEVIENERENDGNGWSSGEDIALLNALKAFPKEAANRWEKITAAVPGRSKAACMKRVSDLKKDFRSSKS